MELTSSVVLDWITLYALKLVAALLILVVGRIVAKGIRSLIRKALSKWNVDVTLVKFIATLSYFSIMAFVIVAALAQIGVQTASFVAIVGAAAFAVGLALQGSLANFASGVLIILFKPFKAGDYVEGGGVAGTVEEVSIFTTVLRSPDNRVIIVPNGKIMADNIVNYSAREIRRVDLVAGVSYSDDIDKVRKVLEIILDEDERVLKDPAPTIGVLELADSSVDFAVRPWVRSSDYWGVFFDLQEKIKKRFDAEGISIPFPQQDVHLHQAE
ncbi:MAG: mechanosensitive ion channel domain-containing protein [Thermovirgaceae bacterium]|jgi:small conductance mechanosensitive channel|nr:mechanosensitive ion channel [Synergistales bacterium]MDI9393073.1 mechanosensitive ion channel [Synergistota bacterium]NLV65880.1 mechanosensitive ion channel [Synergistaceae bacterium]HRV70793.1 mechanosensitive ion channel [Thermovirgaceae bacterium]MDD3134231.1 mechanosensitive ion channel [Synergistales bacterium]